MLKDINTVIQNRVNPKINAPEVSKSAMKRARNFQHKSEISQKLNYPVGQLRFYHFLTY